MFRPSGSSGKFRNDFEILFSRISSKLKNIFHLGRGFGSHNPLLKGSIGKKGKSSVLRPVVIKH